MDLPNFSDDEIEQIKLAGDKVISQTFNYIRQEWGYKPNKSDIEKIVSQFVNQNNVFSKFESELKKEFANMLVVACTNDKI